MAKQQKVTVKVNPLYNAKQMAAIADEIIDRIIERTKAGQDVNGNPWKSDAGEYTEGYIKSIRFKAMAKARGKSPGKVDLTLSGNMLSELQFLENESKAGRLVIGYEKGAEENDKAEGNILGSYGGAPNPKKARDFLGVNDNKSQGINERDLDRILKKYPIAPDTARRRTEEVREKAAEITEKILLGKFIKVPIIQRGGLTLARKRGV